MAKTVHHGMAAADFVARPVQRRHHVARKFARLLKHLAHQVGIGFCKSGKGLQNRIRFQDIEEQELVVVELGLVIHAQWSYWQVKLAASSTLPWPV